MYIEFNCVQTADQHVLMIHVKNFYFIRCAISDCFTYLPSRKKRRGGGKKKSEGSRSILLIIKKHRFLLHREVSMDILRYKCFVM